MTHKVFQKCKKHLSNISVKISHIDTYYGDRFFPCDHFDYSFTLYEDSIFIYYYEYFKNKEDVTVFQRCSITIKYRYISQIVMYSEGKYLHRRCKSYKK